MQMYRFLIISAVTLWLLLALTACGTVEASVPFPPDVTSTPFRADPVPENRTPTVLPALSTARADAGVDQPTRMVISTATVMQMELLTPFIGHTDRITDLAFSADGTYLASASRDGTIRVWDMNRWEEVNTFPISKVDLNCIAFSPEGNLLASAEAIWDVETGKQVQMLEQRLIEVGHVAFSPDGSLLATATFGQPVKLWEVASGEVMFTFQTGEYENIPVFGIQFSPDGSVLAGGGISAIYLWDVKTGQLQEVLEPGEQFGVHDLVFSPDGHLLAAGGTSSVIQLWDVTGARIVDQLIQGAGLYGLAFSPDGSILASANVDRTVKLWDVISGNLLRSLPHGNELMAVTFTPDGRRLASAGYDFVVNVWSVAR